MKAWIKQLFNSARAGRGGISLKQLKQAAKRYGFKVTKNGDQYLVSGRRYFKVILLK